MILRRTSLFIVLLLLCSSVLYTSVSAQTEHNNRSTDSVLTAYLTDIAIAALTTELNVLTGSVTASDTHELSAYYESAIQQQIAQATTRRSALLADEIIYGNYNLQLTVTEVQVDGTVAVVYASEYTAISIENAKTDPLYPATTEYVDEHTFRFEFIDGAWFLIGDQVRMPPNAEIDPELGPVTGPSLSFDSDSSLPFSIYLPMIVSTSADPDMLAANVQEILVDSNAIVSYARKWWNSANPSYRNWLPDNDCTNFVSQALKAGGWAYTTRYPSSKWWSSAWWYESDDQTRTWTAADWFYSFAPNRATAISKPTDLSVGDVLEIDWTGDGSIDHAAIVTKKDSNNKLYLTYHSNNRLDKPLTDIQASYPKAKYYGWKLK